MRGHALILMNWQPSEVSKMLVDCTGSVHGNYDRFHKYTDHKHVDTKTHGYTHSTFKRNKTLVCICHTHCNTLHESTVDNPYIKNVSTKNTFYMVGQAIRFRRCQAIQRPFYILRKHVVLFSHHASFNHPKKWSIALLKLLHSLKPTQPLKMMLSKSGISFSSRPPIFRPGGYVRFREGISSSQCRITWPPLWVEPGSPGPGARLTSGHMPCSFAVIQRAIQLGSPTNWWPISKNHPQIVLILRKQKWTTKVFISSV